jgi:hypothetical protein
MYALTMDRYEVEMWVLGYKRGTERLQLGNNPGASLFPVHGEMM